MVGRFAALVLFVFASGMMEEGGCNETVNFTSNLSVIEVEEGTNVTLECMGFEPSLRVRDEVFDNNSSMKISTISHTITANLSDDNTEASCGGNNTTRVARFAVYLTLKLDNNTTHDVIMGKEQSVVLPYRGNPNFGEFNLTKNGSEIQNFYVEKMSSTEGEIVIHFQKVAQDDLGTYVIAASRTTRTIYYDVIVRGQEAETDYRDIVIIVSPAVSFGICAIVIITMICLVKRKSKSWRTSKDAGSPPKKNHYVSSSERIPAQPPLSCQETSQTRHPNNAMQQNSSGQAPPVSMRTASLSPAVFHPQQPPSHAQFHHMENRKSMDSIDSFENCEEDYENFTIPAPAPGGFAMPSRLIDRNQGFPGRHQSAIASHNPMMQQRPHAATDVRPAVRPKPIKRLYQNQVVANNLQMNRMNDEDDDDQIYEGMN